MLIRLVKRYESTIVFSGSLLALGVVVGIMLYSPRDAAKVYNGPLPEIASKDSAPSIKPAAEKAAVLARVPKAQTAFLGPMPRGEKDEAPVVTAKAESVTKAVVNTAETKKKAPAFKEKSVLAASLPSMEKPASGSMHIAAVTMAKLFVGPMPVVAAAKQEAHGPAMPAKPAIAERVIAAIKPAEKVEQKIEKAIVEKQVAQVTKLEKQIIETQKVEKNVAVVEKQIVEKEVARVAAVVPVGPMKPVSATSLSLNDLAEIRGLPRILSDEDRQLYNRALTLTQQGHWQEARIYLNQTQNPILKGHVLAEHYLHPNHTTSYSELESWLKEYGDLPQAKRVEGLAKRRAPRAGFLEASAKFSKYLNGYGDNNGLSGHIADNNAYLLRWSGRDEAKRAWYQVISQVRQGEPELAFAQLQEAQAQFNLYSLEVDIALWDIAAKYFTRGKAKEALQLAERAAVRSGDSIPGVYWTAGLAAWQMGQKGKAAGYFARNANAEEVSKWDNAAGAYWAYRAYRSIQQPEKANRYLRLAATHPRTFYGVLARYTLGQSLGIEQSKTPKSTIALVLHQPAVQRAIALKEASHAELAEREIRALFPQVSGDLSEGLIEVAGRLNLPAVQIRMAQSLTYKNKNSHRLMDYARYPVPNWQPKEGFRVDPALIYSVMRVESGFNTHARSHQGARGLMQIMPATAKYIAKQRAINHADQDMLYKPLHNLSLGQAYLDYLMQMPEIGSNLVYVAASYNAGPGNVMYWQKRDANFQKDPLLFMESIPVPETRNYVEQVMTNYWIYRELLGKSNPSLQAVADGEWPLYDGVDNQEVASAF